MEFSETSQTAGELAERKELARAIERETHAIVEAWLERVKVDAAAAHVPLTELRDGIGDYLTRLAELLRCGEPLSGIGAAAWGDVAREHAVTRVRLGFDVSQLFRELSTLRQTTTEKLRRAGLLPPSDQVDRIALLVDEAIAASIKSYVDFRDYESRRSEALHIGFLTHELRNPLAVAALATAQLRQVTAPEPRNRLLDMLDRSLDRLRQLIDNVMATERMQAGEVEVCAVDTTLGQLIAESVDNARRSAHDKGIALAATYDPSIPLHVDPKLTRSALDNLLDNAIKFTDVGTVELAIEQRDGEVVVHVRDSCAGLSREELAVIFEPFRRVHANKPGTGLGLAIARRAVEAQGGHIHAESIPDRGCHFWFSLPSTHH